MTAGETSIYVFNANLLNEQCMKTRTKSMRKQILAGRILNIMTIGWISWGSTRARAW